MKKKCKISPPPPSSSSSSSSSSSFSSSSSCIIESPITEKNETTNSIPPKIKPKKRVRSKKINLNATQNSKSRSSIYRGVTRHRLTGRYEAHLWDKTSWNNIQSKRGRQIYLGAYDNEEDAGRTYDLAALKYWGPTSILNFPVETYTKEVEEMENLSKEEYLTTLRRRSSGFSRGVSKYRGVARHHHNGRWEARIGRVSGNKYLYLGTYNTQEEAAMAYDMAAIEHRGPNAVTNFDINNYMDKNMPKIEVKEEDVEMKQELITPNSLNKVVQPDENETHNHYQGDNQIETSVISKLEPPINTSDSQAMDPIEEHKQYPWDLCLDNSFSSIPIPDISLEEASEFLRLFDDNGFEELDIEFTFDDPFGDIEFLMRDDHMSMSGDNGFKGTGGVSTSHSSSSLSTMTSDDCSSI